MFLYNEAQSKNPITNHTNQQSQRSNTINTATQIEMPDQYRRQNFGYDPDVNFDGPYGNKNLARIEAGAGKDPASWSNEVEHHGKEYQDDREYQERRYAERAPRFDAARTENIRRQYSEYNPRRRDSAEFKKKLETARGGLYDEDRYDRQEEELKREAVTTDNQNADRDRRHAGIAHIDYGHPPGHPLREGYRRAENKRHDLFGTSSGRNRREDDRELPERRRRG